MEVSIAYRPIESTSEQEIQLSSSGIQFIKMQNRNFDVSINPETWLGVSEESDAREMRQLAVQHKPDLLVMDHYGISEKWIRELDVTCPKLMICDLPAPRGLDYVLDYGFDASESKHKNSSTARHFLGPKFSLVMNSGREGRSPGSKSSPPRLLIAIGAGASVSLWIRIIEIIRKCYPEASILAAVPPRLSLEIRASFRDEIQYVDTWTPLGSLFPRVEAAIVNAGVSLYEALEAGIPYVSIVTADNQIPSATSKLARKNLNVVCDSSESSFEMAVAQLRQNLENPKLLELVSRSLVDGRGPDRVAMLIANPDRPTFIIRPFDPEDSPFLFGLVNQGSIRQSSFDSEEISPSDHLEWIAKGGDRRRIWIFEVDGIPVGQCRLDSSQQGEILSYSIDEAFRGKGYGNEMLSLVVRSTSSHQSRLIAFVKPENEPSIKALKSAGFQFHGEQDSKFEFRLEF
jgi:spore coat polysaccharide biosynthesis predicted glycosyltransferase SpsG/RimJ/RimL family protein N-acetyltransferase